MSPIFQCQDTDIKTQLENGYRYLDMRLVLKNDNLILKHNFAKCKKERSIFSTPLTLDDVLEDIYTFLDKHPSETVIFCAKKENGTILFMLRTYLFQNHTDAKESENY